MIAQIILNKDYKKEADFQKDICLLLDDAIKKENLIYYFSVPNGVILGGKNSFALMKMLKNTGFKSGVSDLVLIFKDSILFLELKLDGNKLSQYQENFKKIVSQGVNYHYLTITPTKHLDTLFKLLGVPKCKY